MSEYIEALRRDYPAIDDMLEQYGDSSLAEYLGRIGHRELPEILPSEDLLEAVESHLTPFFGRETASRAAAVLGRQRCLSTANHHHFSFDYSTVQDTLLYEQWLRKHGETEGVVPIFAAANVHLQNSAFPRGILIYDCGLPEKKLKLPLFPHKMKHTCVAGIGGVDPSMVQAARTRLRQVKENGTIGPAMYRAISEFYETIVMSDAAQSCGSYRAQTTVVNEQLSRQYFTDRSPRYLWMPMEDIAAELLQKDLRQEEGLLNRLLFHPPLRACLMGRLDGVSGCWTGTSAGTHFFWGLDGRGVLFAMHLETAQGATLLTGTDSAGGTVTVPLPWDGLRVPQAQNAAAVSVSHLPGTLFFAGLYGIWRLLSAHLSQKDADRARPGSGGAGAFPAGGGDPPGKGEPSDPGTHVSHPGSGRRTLPGVYGGTAGGACLHGGTGGSTGNVRAGFLRNADPVTGTGNFETLRPGS